MRTFLHTFVAVFIIALVCTGCQPAAEDPTTQTQAPEPVSAEPTAPTKAADISWRFLGTINHCHLYEVRFQGKDHLLATSSRRSGSGGVSASCTFVEGGA